LIKEKITSLFNVDQHTINYDEVCYKLKKNDFRDVYNTLVTTDRNAIIKKYCNKLTIQITKNDYIQFVRKSQNIDIIHAYGYGIEYMQGLRNNITNELQTYCDNERFVFQRTDKILGNIHKYYISRNKIQDLLEFILIFDDVLLQ